MDKAQAIQLPARERLAGSWREVSLRGAIAHGIRPVQLAMELGRVGKNDPELSGAFTAIRKRDAERPASRHRRAHQGI